jgi:hypothetical protein
MTKILLGVGITLKVGLHCRSSAAGTARNGRKSKISPATTVDVRIKAAIR